MVTKSTFLTIPREKWGNGGSTSPHSLRVQKCKIEHDVVRLVLRPGTGLGVGVGVGVVVVVVVVVGVVVGVVVVVVVVVGVVVVVD